MKRILSALILTAAAAATPALADVGVSVSVGDPGFYGRIDIGNYPAPALVYPQPMIIQRGPSLPPPVYLYVPPWQARDWRRYCYQYNACGRPVYFVQERWYNNVYVPRYREMHRDRHWDDRRGPGPGRGWDGDRGHDHDRGYDRDRGRRD